MKIKEQMAPKSDRQTDAKGGTAWRVGAEEKRYGGEPQAKIIWPERMTGGRKCTNFWRGSVTTIKIQNSHHEEMMEIMCDLLSLTMADHGEASLVYYS